jgi:hypothetical protein
MRRHEWIELVGHFFLIALAGVALAWCMGALVF